MIDEKMINERCDILLRREIAAHVLKKNKEWCNGFIKEVGSNFIVLDEFKKGKMIIFFSDIFNIETYTKVVEK